MPLNTSVLFLIGVSACGKTSVGKALAKTLPNAVFVDADDYHSSEAKSKMATGVPLTDKDREPWLARVGEAASAKIQERSKISKDDDAPFHVVVACSALKRTYRDTLRRIVRGSAGGLTVRFVHLAADRQVLEKRLRERSQSTVHFLRNTPMLDSQFATLEPPSSDEGAIIVDVTSFSPDQISQDIQKRI